MKWARKQRTGGPAETALLLVLALEADQIGICKLSTRAIAGKANTNQPTARRVLARLQNRGLVSWSAGAGRAPSTYRLPL